MSYFKVRNPLNQKQKVVKGPSDVLASDFFGQSYVSEYIIDDTAAASAVTLWSSEKILESTIAPVSPAVAGDLAALTVTGTLQDAGVAVNDSAVPSSTVLYSSSKNDSVFQKLVSPSVAGDLASLDAAGQTVDSGLLVDDSAVAASNVLYSSLKINTLLADKIFVRGSFNVVPVPNLAFVQLSSTPTENVGGGWAGNLFTAPRTGFYVVGFVIQSDGTAGVAAGSYWEGICYSSTGQQFVNVTFYQTALGAQNCAVAASGAFQLSAGDTVNFQIHNVTGSAQTLAVGEYSTFYIGLL